MIARQERRVFLERSPPPEAPAGSRSSSCGPGVVLRARAGWSLVDVVVTAAALVIVALLLVAWLTPDRAITLLEGEMPRRWILVDVLIEDSAAVEPITVGDEPAAATALASMCQVAAAPRAVAYRSLYPDSRRSDPSAHIWLVRMRLRAAFPRPDEPLFGGTHVKEGATYYFRGRRSSFQGTVWRWYEDGAAPDGAP